MQYIHRAWLAIVLVLTGCRLPGWEGPVSRSLADCRRLSQQGVVALDRGQQEKAETLLAKAVAACPVDAEARRRYAEALWRRGAKGGHCAIGGRRSRDARRRRALDANGGNAIWPRARSSLPGKRPSGRWTSTRSCRAPGRFAAGCAGRPASRKRRWPIISALGYTPSDRAMLREVAELYRHSTSQNGPCKPSRASPKPIRRRRARRLPLSHRSGLCCARALRRRRRKFFGGGDARKAHGGDVLPTWPGRTVGRPRHRGRLRRPASPDPRPRPPRQPRPARPHRTRPAAAGNGALRRGAFVFLTLVVTTLRLRLRTCRRPQEPSL